MAKKLILGALAVPLVLWLPNLVMPSHRPHACALCRLEKVDYRWFWLSWSSWEGNDCSRWYRDHVERSHRHAWVQRGYCQPFGIPGLFGGYACYFGPPVTRVPRGMQVDVYRHFEDPRKAKELFLRLGSKSDESNRLWEALTNWSMEGYPGTWHDWWKAYRARSGEFG